MCSYAHHINKNTTLAFRMILSKVDEHCKRLKDNDLRIGTWNIRTLHRIGASHIVNVLMKCRTDITYRKCNG